MFYCFARQSEGAHQSNAFKTVPPIVKNCQEFYSKKGEKQVFREESELGQTCFLLSSGESSSSKLGQQISV